MSKFILVTAAVLSTACGSSGGGGGGSGGAAGGAAFGGGGNSGSGGGGAAGSGGSAASGGAAGSAGQGGGGGAGGSAPGSKFKRIGRMAAPGGPVSDTVGGFGMDAAASCVVFRHNAHTALVGTDDGLGFSQQVYHLDVATGVIARVSLDDNGKPNPGGTKPESHPGWYNGGAAMRVVNSDCSRVAFTSTATGVKSKGYVRDLKSKTTTLVSFADGSSNGVVLSFGGIPVFQDFNEGRAGGPPWTAPMELWTADPTTGTRTWLSWTPQGGGAAVPSGAQKPHLSDSGTWLIAELGSSALCLGKAKCAVRREMATGKWDFVAARADGKPAAGSSAVDIALSGDGMSMIFKSSDDILNDGEDTQGKSHLYYIDFANKGAWALNQKQDGSFASDLVGFDISADGRYAAFVADDSLIGLSGGSGLFRYDAQLDKLEALNLDASGKPYQGPFALRPSFLSPRISADGKRVIVLASEFPGKSHGLGSTPADDKDTGFYLWEE